MCALSFVSMKRNFSQLPQFLLVSEVFYVNTMMALKISVGLFFLRIFFDRWMRWAVKLIMVVCVLVAIAYTFEIIFQCGAPITEPGFWEKTLTHSCFGATSVLDFAYTHAVLMALTDVSLVVLPIIFVYGTKKPLRVKLQIGGILTIGAV